MNLKKRLGIAFVIIVILPIAMVMISLDFLSAYLGDSFKRNYEYEGGTLEIIANPMNVVNRMTHREADQIVQYADERPEDLENERILSGINDKLIPMDSFLVVREDGEFIYVGKEGMEKSLEDILPAYGSNISIENGVYYGGSDPLLIKQHDYISDDNKKGSVFIVSKVSVILPQLKSTMRLLIIIGVAILLITAILLILWLYDGITVPVKRLKKAMNELKEGNLNYKIESSSKDEIGELCDDFDAMRIQLKDLVNEQISREKRTREMLSNVSHDLKTPLTAIKGYAEGLLDGIAVNPKMQEKYMRTIWNKANDMQELTDDLSFYARLENDDYALDFRETGIGEYFKERADDVLFDMEEKGFDFSFENLLSAEKIVAIDRKQMKRVFSNIVWNSVKYNDKEKGEISVKLEEDGDFVKITFADNGPGVSEDALPHIFERFYREDTARNTKTGGTGLGLAIVKKIVEVHDGNISALSKEGEGLTVIVKLPVKISK